MMFRRIKNENGYGLFIVAFLCFDSLQSNEKILYGKVISFLSLRFF